LTWIADQPRVGHWSVRVVRNGPYVASRIYWEQCKVDPVSGEPMQRSAFLVGQIGLDIVRIADVWTLVEFLESSPEQKAALANPPLSSRVPRGNRAPAFQTAPLPLWRQSRARRITQAEYEQEVVWLTWAARNNPSHPEYNWRKPLDRKTATIPRFERIV
jgi:hypothetical protein